MRRTFARTCGQRARDLELVGRPMIAMVNVTEPNASSTRLPATSDNPEDNMLPTEQSASLKLETGASYIYRTDSMLDSPIYLAHSDHVRSSSEGFQVFIIRFNICEHCGGQKSAV